MFGEVAQMLAIVPGKVFETEADTGWVCSLSRSFSHDCSRAADHGMAAQAQTHLIFFSRVERCKLTLFETRHENSGFRNIKGSFSKRVATCPGEKNDRDVDLIADGTCPPL